MRRDESGPPPHRPGDGPGTPADDAERRADQEHMRELQRARQAKVVKVLVVLVVVVIFMVFIISNDDPAKVNFVFFSRHPPLIWVMFACALIGGFIGYLIGRPGRQMRLHRRKREEKD
jgi:uncharacterized integral membrane protein